MSFAALALRARAANDTTQAQINNILSKSHVIPLLMILLSMLIYYVHVELAVSTVDAHQSIYLAI